MCLCVANNRYASGIDLHTHGTVLIMVCVCVWCGHGRKVGDRLIVDVEISTCVQSMLIDVGKDDGKDIG